LADSQHKAVQMAEEIVMATEARIEELEDMPIEDVCVDEGCDVYGVQFTVVRHDFGYVKTEHTHGL